MIRKVLYLALRSTYALIWLVTLTLAVCLWMFGPFIVLGEWDPFADPMDRIIWIGGLLGFALFLTILIWFLRRRRDRKMNEDIVASTETDDEEDDGVQSEAEEMRQKLRTALAQLRKSKMGSKSLYELPWYVMIGPPGAGKTTAIVNSGLKFPLVEEFGQASIGGVGGTRNCDWWFTDNAVMIDTAGRYTTQESDAEADNQGWLNFLTLLKKHRKRQPINGAIIAISLSDLSMQDEVTQAGHARAIRRRLHELREKLGVRFPVYVIFTKADLIAGFTEFYDNLGKEAREQVWGFTLPFEKARANVSPVAAFDDEFSLLLTQLNAQSLERLQSETDHQRRSLVAGFPGQVASVRQVARDFLNEVFQDNKFSERHMLRGVYFASGTQEGTPIDRLMMGMARTFGIGRQAIGSGKGTGRSYFLTRLFEGVIFREAGLVSSDDKVERRYKIARGLAIAATLVAAVAAGGIWLRSFLGNQALIAETTERMKAYDTAASVIPPSPVGDSDIATTVPALNILRGLPSNPLAGDVPPAGTLGYGLYQGRIIGASAGQSYRAALNQHLLPRLLLRLENQMQGSMSNPEFLYEVLKVYLMLGQQGPLNAELVREYLVNDWNASFTGIGAEELKTSLRLHLDALMSQPMQKIALNGPLVEQAQDILSQMPMAQRIYNGIINSPKALELPKWRITDVGGPAVDRVFVRSSGKPLNEGIEGIYTYDGFNNVFLGEALGVSRRLQSEAWVLGEKNVAVQSEVAILAVARDVLDLYYNDFIARYEGILSDVDIIPMSSMSQAVEVTNVLSGPTSPLVNLLMAVAQETRLTEDRNIVPGAAVGEGISAAAGIELRSMLSAQAAVFINALEAANPGGPKPKPPGVFVEERFAWLHTLVARTDNQPSQLDQLRVILEEVYREMSRLAITSGAGGLVAPNQDSALIELIQLTQRLPGPMQRWTSQIAAGSSGVSAEGTRATVNAKWQAQVLPVCEQSFAGRYPFNRRSASEVGIADFTRMFSPGGLLDTFFNENLAQFVDTRTRPWTFKQVNGADLGMAPAALEAFMHAADIRAAFFPQGPVPAARFSVTPSAVDPNATSVTLEIDGAAAKLTQGDGQPPPTGVVWPGAAGYGRLTFEPPLQGVENALRRDGPWGWFRLLDSAEIRNTDVNERKRLIFKVGGRVAIFFMQSDSALNPFALPALYKFSCPKSF
ncbi:MAG: type VI secretion system membrane subunit TssM [Paracoccaceae bacterium]|nr:MAG: type VI secretion system membrane subunit TssM [Paracoccaceae bacterium]